MKFAWTLQRGIRDMIEKYIAYTSWSVFDTTPLQYLIQLHKNQNENLKNLQMYVFSLTTDINQIFPVFHITRLSMTTMHINTHKVLFFFSLNS